MKSWAKFGVLLGLTAVMVSCGGSGGGSTSTNPAPTATLSANPTVMATGSTQPVKLTFTSTNATAGSINNNVGTVGINGSVSVPAPAATTTYVFTATGPGGSATASATVTVAAPPTVSISAQPSSIVAGNSTTLTVTATGATQVVITDGTDTNIYPLSATGGSETLSPAATITYTATATAADGLTASASITVTVLPPPPTVTITANPMQVNSGQSTLLTATATNSTKVVISDNVDSNTYTLPAGGGTETVTPTATTIYTATATGLNGSVVKATVTVTVAPVNSFDGIVASQVTSPTNDVDPNGAVGTKQFMEYVNTDYQAYDKVTNLPVWPSPQPIGTPWTAPLNNGGTAIEQCDALSIRLDAVILFDRQASRWVIGGKTTREDHYYFCIAVSNTDDLTNCVSTSCWYGYFFSLDSALGTNSMGDVYLPDWPKMGTWPSPTASANAYWAAMDLNDPDNSDQESGVVACAFQRANMLTGNTQGSVAMLCYTVSSPSSVYLAHSLIPADFDGTNPPPALRDEFMVSIQNPPLDGITTTSSMFNLWDFQLDWTSSTLTLNNLSQPSVETYTPGCYTLIAPTVTTCVPEPPANGIGQKIDSVGDRFMPRFDYRNFGTYESFLASHTVQTGLGMGQDAAQTGIRWYELQGNESGTDTPAITQQGTIAPDATYFRFLPSIAQDKDGNAAVGYSVSNPAFDPAIDFSYWNLPTPTTPAEVTIINGAGEEQTGGNGQGQWGSYSGISVDPSDDCTFWYVNEYWPTSSMSSVWSTRIAYFKVPTCQ